MTADTLAVAGTGELASPTIEANIRTVLVAALMYSAQPENFPAFRRWCLGHADAANAPGVAEWMVGISPTVLHGISEAFVAGSGLL
jgi:hypothetical protein